MDGILRQAQRAAFMGGEDEGQALLKALARSGRLTLSLGREIIVPSSTLRANIERIQLTERAEGLNRCWNCQGRLGKGRRVLIWDIPQIGGFLPFCCVSCRETYQNDYPVEGCCEPCCS
jgi:hypothetical protein